MYYQLRPGLTYCCSADQFIFLDEKADRYFALSAKLAAAFADITASGGCDIAAGERLMAMGVLVDSTRAGPINAVIAQQVHVESPAIANGRCSAPDVLRAIIDQRVVMHRMRRAGFAKCLDGLRLLKARSASVGSPKGRKAERCIRAFDQAKLLFAHADRCLPRSLALATRLTRLGVHAELVLGVTAVPFAAHAWVQAGDAVLNDSAEEVRKYSVILRI